jgi:hypothetical protein
MKEDQVQASAAVFLAGMMAGSVLAIVGILVGVL